MKLHTLLHGIVLTNLPNYEISAITSDSRKVCEGSLFVCIKGKNFDGHEVAQEMLEKGALVVVCERDLGLENQIIVDNTRIAYSYICANWFGRSDKKLKIIGVTGTNGKTTITTVLQQVITACGKKTGLIGTSHNGIGDKVMQTERTTPESYELFSLLAQMVEEGCEYVAMEVSSQALEQHRTDPLHYSAVIFTNLTQDHLDVHGTMENYYQAKKLIFKSCDFAIINADDEAGRRYFVEINCPKYSYTIENAGDYYTDCVKLSAEGSTFWISDGIRTYYVSLIMPGYFNVSNMTAVIACCDRLGFDVGKVIEVISAYKGVKGRAEVIPTGTDFKVICDYAHTPDALEKILTNIREVTDERLICLFGCGGNRDRKKRPIMAEIAAKHSDYVIISSDNPRNEDPDEIIAEVVKGIENTDTPYFTEADRRKAIFHALKIAQKGDIILLAGKGHEDYQVLENERKIHLDEREVVSEGLTLLKNGQL